MYRRNTGPTYKWTHAYNSNINNRNWPYMCVKYGQGHSTWCHKDWTYRPLYALFSEESIYTEKSTKTIFTWNFKNYNQKNVLEYLFKMLWSVIDALEDPRNQLYFFLTFFNEATKLHAPIMERRVRANDVLWKSSEINKMNTKKSTGLDVVNGWMLQDGSVLLVF